MAKVLIYFAHPGQSFSRVNKEMFAAAQAVDDITVVDLYGIYPRQDINIEVEQARLLDHDVILFQFPLFWYSTPSLIKEWQDLVLEHGFAYGKGGDKLAGKVMMLALTAAGPADAYTAGGFQRHELRTFLTPLEQTAHLCKMRFPAPYVLYASLKAETEEISAHVQGYTRLIRALRDDVLDLEAAIGLQTLHHDTLPLKSGGA